MNKVYCIGFSESPYESDQDWIISRNVKEATDFFLTKFWPNSARDMTDLEPGFCVQPWPMSSLLPLRIEKGTVVVKKVEDHVADAMSRGAVVPFLLKREKSQRLYLVGDEMVATHVIIATSDWEALNFYYELMGPGEIARVRDYYQEASEVEFLQCLVREIPENWYVQIPTDEGTCTALVGETVYEAVRGEEKVPRLFGILRERITPDWAIPVPCLMFHEQTIAVV